MSKPLVMPVARPAARQPAEPAAPPPSAAPPAAPVAPPQVDDEPILSNDFFAAIAQAEREEQTANIGAGEPPPHMQARGRSRPPATPVGVPSGVVWGMTFVVLALIAAGAWQWNEMRQDRGPTPTVGVPGRTAAETPSLTPPPPVGSDTVAVNPVPQPAALPPTETAPPVTPPQGAGPPARSTVTPATPARRAEPALPDAAQAAAGLDNGAARAAGRGAGAVIEPDNPRAVCAPRQQFALYYCMQQQCETSRFFAHAQCIDLRRRGEVN